MMRKLFSAILALAALLGAEGVGLAQTTVYLKPAEALKLIFKNSQEVLKEDHPVTDEVRRKAEAELKYELPKDRYAFYVGKTEGRVDGYAVIDEQVGKVQPITFVTKISPEGRVDAVEVMVYRESHGGEVASRRFLNQFRQKDLNNELRLHGDIVNISGATLSAHALVVGVKRALVLWQIFYGKS